MTPTGIATPNQDSHSGRRRLNHSRGGLPASRRTSSRRSASAPAGDTDAPSSSQADVQTATILSATERARRLDHVAGLFAPTLAGTAALVPFGASAGELLWMAASLFVAALAGAGCYRYPVAMMPLARASLDVVVPALGTGLFFLPNLLLGDASGLGAWALLAALAAALSTRTAGSLFMRRHARRRPIRLAVIGSAGLTRRVAAELAATSTTGFELVGYVAAGKQTDQQGPSADTNEARLLGALGEASQIAKDHRIDIFVLDEDAPQQQILRTIIDVCLDLPVRAIRFNALHEQLTGYVPIGTISATWYEYVIHPTYSARWRPLSKRCIDLLGGVIAGLFALPLIGVLAALVRLEDGGPAFYRQERTGERGRRFHIVKLRSMSVDAQGDSDPEWSGADDPRVTRVGRFLRTSHLDELPQIWNVIKGEMTLVGPRPEQPGLVEEMETEVPHYSRRLLVKPGLTGWAQVSCGYPNTLSGTAWKMAHDLYYLKRRSLTFDLLILVETVRTVLVGTRYDLEPPNKTFLLGATEERACPPQPTVQPVAAA